MRLLFPTLLAILFGAPIMAQDLDQRFRSVGEMKVMLGGNAHTMVIPFDTEKNKSYATERAIMGRRMFNVFGSVVTANGKPGKPSLQITFFVKDGVPDLVSMEIFDEQGRRKPLSISPDAGKGEFASFEISAENTITASFSGEMLRLDNSDSSGPKLVAGAAPVAIKGTVTVTVPAKE